MSEEKAKDEKKKELVELTLFDLVLRDKKIDLELIKTFRGNITAVKGYMASIGNMRTRETIRKFLIDTDGVLSQMANQSVIIIAAIEKAQKKCESEQPPAKDPSSSQPTTSAESATEKKLTSSDPKTSSVPDAPEQEKSPAQTE